MIITQQLSSQVGDRTEASNKAVAAQCLENPAHLADIHAGLSSKNADLQGDCAEVLTLVAEQRPDWVVPYAGDLLALLAHKKTRVRWEAMHALSLIAQHVPELIESNLPLMNELIQKDASTIVRDHAVDAVGHYAGVGPGAAGKAYPDLQQALSVLDGKHARQALYGLGNVASHLPEKRAEIRALAGNSAITRKAWYERRPEKFSKEEASLDSAKRTRSLQLHFIGFLKGIPFTAVFALVIAATAVGLQSLLA